MNDKENVVCIHIGVLYSHKEEWNYCRKWKELEVVMLSDRSQARKAKYGMLFACMWNLDLKWWWWWDMCENGGLKKGGRRKEKLREYIRGVNLFKVCHIHLWSYYSEPSRY
jgi:hypothetical protein